MRELNTTEVDQVGGGVVFLAGWLIGTYIYNNHLSEDTQNVIGGTIDAALDILKIKEAADIPH